MQRRSTTMIGDQPDFAVFEHAVISCSTSTASALPAAARTSVSAVEPVIVKIAGRCGPRA